MRWDRFRASGHSLRTLIVLALFGLGLLTGLSPAQQPAPPGLPQPRLFTIMPVGGKIGTTVEIVLSGQDLEDPEGLVFSHNGIKAELAPDAPPPPDPKDKNPKAKTPPATAAVKYKVTIPADMPQGIHDVRVFNKWGVSNPRAFVVGDQTDVVEKKPNNDIPQAQKVELNTTINGTIGTPTEVDYYSFNGKKGQRVVLSCLASSIDSRLHPVIELYDSAGKRLATNRDYHGQDALLDNILANDGDYFVRVFMFTHTTGGPDHFYRLSISTAPWIDVVFPSVVEPGKQTQLTVYGRNLPGGQPEPTAVLNGAVLEKMTVNVNVPADPILRQRLAYSGHVAPQNSVVDGFEYRVRNAAGMSNAFMLAFSRAPVTLENGTNLTRETAQALTVPCEVSGRLEKKHPHGWFSFSAKKGDVLSVEVLSDRLGSPTDLVMALYNADTKALVVELDDDPEILSLNQFFTRTSDPGRYKLVVAADAKYQLVVKSQDTTQLTPRHYYHLRITPEQPDYRLVLMPTSVFQPEAAVIHQGTHQELAVFVWRLDGFGGDIALTAEGLPPGVTCQPQTVAPGAKAGSLVLTADAGAAPWVGEIKIKGTAMIAGQPVVREARSASITWPNPPQQVNVPTFTRLDRGNILAVRENGPYLLTAEADKKAVAVGDKLNFKLKIDRHWPDLKVPVQVTAALPIVLPGQAAPAQPITSAAVTIAADKTDGTAVVDFKANTPPGNYTIVFRGNAQADFAKDKAAKKAKAGLVLPSNPVMVTVIPKQVANVTLVPPAPNGKIGAPTEVMVKVARLFDFPGEFKVSLVPPANAKGISADEVTIPAGKDEVKLIINVAADAPPGNLANVLVRAVAKFAGEHETIQEAKFNLNIAK